MDDYGAIIASGQNLVPDLQKQLLQRAQIAAYGAQTQENQAQAAAIMQKQMRAQQFQQAFSQSDGSPQAVARLMMQFPEFADQLKSGWDVVDSANHEADLTSLGEIYSAAKENDWALASKTAHARYDAEIAAGRGSDSYKQTMDILDKAAGGDPRSQALAKTILGSLIAAKTGTEHFATTYGALKPDITVIDGIAVDQNTGQPLYQSPYPRIIPGQNGSFYEQPRVGSIPVLGGQAVEAPAVGGGVPEASGGSNNNPGGLRVPGSSQFQKFPTLQAGIKAQEALLGRYFKRGLNNVSSIIETYAPRQSKGGDNTDEQVNNYIGYVAQRLGVNPMDPLNSPMVPKVAQAMREFETGKRQSGGPRKVRSIQEAQALPPGTVFLTPDGRLKVR